MANALPRSSAPARKRPRRRRRSAAASAADPLAAGARSPRETLLLLALGYGVARALYVAAKLEIPDRLQDGARNAEDLARAIGAHAPSLYRLLRALAAIGVVEERPRRRFALTALGAPLAAAAPDSVRAGLLMFHQPMFWKSWEALETSVRTGRPAFDAVFGGPVFEYLAAHPEAAAFYGRGMTGLNRALIPAIVRAYDFSRFGRIVDVAGGHGSLLAAVLEAAPRARGVLLDLPHVAEAARAELAARGFGARVEVVAGSMFERIAPGGDLYLLKWILHDWSDADCAKILAGIRAAIAPRGRLLAIERVLPERIAAGVAARSAAIADLTMMVHLTGRERTRTEFRALLAGAGFRLRRVIPTECPLSLIEALPA